MKILDLYFAFLLKFILVCKICSLSLNLENHLQEVMSMLQEIREVQGITDQVDYLMESCQVQNIFC